MKLSIFVADNASLYREALALIIKQRIRSADVIEIGTAKELICALSSGESPDVVLIDLGLKGLNSIAGFVDLINLFPETPFIAMNTTCEPLVVSMAYEQGAAGFVSHAATPEYLISVIRTVASGMVFFPDLDEKNRSMHPDLLAGYAQKVSQLSARQLTILIKVTEGKLNKEIGMEMHLSLFTVKSHMKTILRVLGVISRTEAAIIARQVGLNYHTHSNFLIENFSDKNYRRRLNSDLLVG